MNKSTKKIHRFYVEYIPESKEIELTEKKLIHQLTTVLRYKKDDSIILFSNNSNDYLFSIEKINKNNITLSLRDIFPATISPDKNIIAIVSIIKKDNFELIVQKLTEIGVKTIVPLISSRTIKSMIRHDRLQQISLEALEQSGGNRLVDIRIPIKLEDSLKQFSFNRVVFDPMALKKDMPTTSPDITMYIGPEGGWSNEELSLFDKYGVTKVKLSDTILRTETAAIIGAYKLLY